MMPYLLLLMLTALTPDAITPLEMALSDDGRHALVAGEDDHSLRVVDLTQKRMIRTISLHHRPNAVATMGHHAVVANIDDDSITYVNWNNGQLIADIDCGHAPVDIVFHPDGRYCFVSNGLSANVSVIDLEIMKEIKRIPVFERPGRMSVQPQLGRVFVASLIALPHPPRQRPMVDVASIGLQSFRIEQRTSLPDMSLVRGIATTASGDILVAALRPKNLLPLVHVAGGWTIVNALGYINNGQTHQVALDTFSECFANPADIAINRSGSRAYVVIEGRDVILEIDMHRLKEVAVSDDPYLADRLDVSPQFITRRFATGVHPSAVQLTPDEQHLIVTNRLEDNLSMIRIGDGHMTMISLDHKPGKIDPVRNGERLFYEARTSFNGQFSCASCHPRGEHDGLVYDISPDGLGRNFVDTKTLYGLNGTAPFKWSGLNPDLHAQCGPRAAMFINRSAGFTEKELDDLVSFMDHIPVAPNRAAKGALNEQQTWGKEIYERTVDNTGAPIDQANQCTFCHPPPRFTNNRAFDVGTRAKSDKSGLVDTPPLNNLIETAPFLHDGKALTLEELWTVFNPDDRHGRANDLSKEELNALIEYLKTL